MNKAERDALCERLQRENVAMFADMAQRRERRLLAGDAVEWNAPVIRKRFEPVAVDQKPMQAAELSDAELDVLVEFVNERIAEEVMPLIERIKILEGVIELRSSVWLNKMRGTR